MANFIYSDEIFGMNAPNKLYYWFAAYQGKSGNFLYKLIEEYFQKWNIYLTDSIMDQIFSP